MTSKAFGLAQLGNAYADGALSNRNLIINGAMQVWQRGTSQTTSGDYGADRFWMANAASASRSTDVPAGFTYSTKLTYSAATMSMGQPIELVATGNSAPMVAGQQVTLSFYAKVDSGTEDFVVGINFRDNKFSGANQASFNAIGGSTLTATTTWQRFAKTFTVPTVNGTNVLAGLEINNIDKDFYLTGVQLEAGDTATPFEHRSYGQELALCQRYYEKSYNIDVVPGTNSLAGALFCSGSTNQYNDFTFSRTFSVVKRATPSIVFYQQATGTVGTWNSERSGSIGTGTPVAYAVGTSKLGGYVPLGAAFVSASIYGHWTASAEL